MAVDKNMTILVVDDFQTMRRIVVNLLGQLGFKNTIEAADGASAFEIVENQPVDFIVSDWNMPHMDGLEFLKAVRSHEKYKHIPFIMVTAEGKKENVVIAVQAGVSNYIVKPFNAAILKEKMSKVMDGF